MKRQDTVFLLTLIDFLFQVIFFGLFLYAIYAAKQDPSFKKAFDTLKEKYASQSGEEVQNLIKKLPLSVESLESLDMISNNKKAIDNELRRQGVSNIVELTDELSKLAPVRELKSVQLAVDTIGGKQELLELSQLIESSGGNKQAKDALQAYIKEGVGKPHCDPITDSKGKVTGAYPLASVTASDNKLVFNGNNQKLQTVLLALGLQYKQIESLTPENFKSIFKSVPSKFPHCVHMIAFKEETRLVDARDAVRPYFRMNITKLPTQRQ